MKSLYLKSSRIGTLQNIKNYLGIIIRVIKNLHRNGACGSVVVKALCYKPEGRGFDIR
jgi:hypothetical protein